MSKFYCQVTMPSSDITPIVRHLPKISTRYLTMFYDNHKIIIYANFMIIIKYAVRV